MIYASGINFTYSSIQLLKIKTTIADESEFKKGFTRSPFCFNLLYTIGQTISSIKDVRAFCRCQENT